ncbi:MAG TPA: ATP-binding protein [Candidatus Polarisedimenticolia bacterium]|nr:ATP-binding protein [Candidatus Polarisedimenticolia bacterium]
MRLPFVPIRIKILISVLFVVTAVVSVITYTMANMFHEDKRTYINDLASVVTLNTAQECRALLVGYRERLQAYARIIGREELPQVERAALLKGFFEDFPALVAVTLYRGGEEVASAVDEETLREAGLTKEALKEQQRAHPLPFARIQAGEVFVENSTLAEKLPTLTLATADAPGKDARPAAISAVVRLDDLLSLTRRSGVFDIFITDAAGTLLAHPDVARVARKESIPLRPEVAGLDARHSAGITLEYLRGGARTIGGFAPVDFGRLFAVAEIPKSAAYLATRSLLNHLLVVALGLLFASSFAGLFWSRRITRPMEDLSLATREVAKGRFDIQVEVKSHDEIGTLASSFNHMAIELKDRETALHEAQAQLIQSEKLAAVGQLGAGIAHEVKNPLAGILGCAQLSMRDAPQGTLLAKNLQLIEKETKRCKVIIENLLKFARQEKALLEPTDLNRVVEDAIAIVLHQLELNQVKVQTHLAPGLPQIRGNANQLQQVFMNLMINAQHAMEGSQGTVVLSTALTAPDRIEVRVSDTGPGIPQEIQKRIFEPFFTTKPTGKGTGLGLSVSYGIVKDHGGEIRSESEPGKGAIFVITLPVMANAATS